MSAIANGLGHLIGSALKTFDGLPGDARTIEPTAFVEGLRWAMDSARANAEASQGGKRFDDAHSLIAKRSLEQLMAEVIETKQRPHYAGRVMQVGSFGIAPWVDSFIQERITYSGLAGYVDSGNMPEATAHSEEIPRKLYTLGDKFSWSWFDMQRAAQAGVPLRDRRARAARRAAENAQEIILIEGDGGAVSGTAIPNRGAGYISTGFVNDPTVPTTSAVTGNWGTTATADQIIGDVQAFLAVYRAQSQRHFVANKLALPEVEFTRIETLRVGDTGVSVKKYLLDNIEGLDDIVMVPALETAGTGATTRAVFYSDSVDVVRGVVPMPFGFLAPMVMGFMTEVAGVIRIGGCEIREPTGMLYIDGI